MSNAKQMTSAYDMHHDGSLSLWDYAHQPREPKAAPHTQLSIMRSRLETVTASHAPNGVVLNGIAQLPVMPPKSYDETKQPFHASPVFKSEEVIERVVNILLIMTIMFVVAWISISILTNNNELASHRSMIDMSSSEPPASTGFAPMAATNFLPEVGGNIDLDQVMGAPTAMHIPVPLPSLEDIEAMEADDGTIPNSSVNVWDNAHSMDQMDI